MYEHVKHEPRRTKPRHSVTGRLSVLLALLFLLFTAALVYQSPHRAVAGTGAAGDTSHEGARWLTPDSLVTAEIAGGETQTFEVELGARQYLHLSIERRDLNLALTVYGPDGRNAGVYAGRRYGEMEASLIAEAAGTHRLEVRSLEKDAAGRRYELRVKALRSAGAQDFRFHAALKITAEASKLRAEWAKDSLRAAVIRFMEARLAWRVVRRPDGAVDALLDAAEVYFTFGDYGQALRLYEEAAAESRRAGDRHREQEAICYAARTRSHLGQNDLAQMHLEAVLAYCERQGCAGGTPRDKRLLAGALANMGEVYHTKGIPLKAIGYLRRSLALWGEAGDRAGEATARLNLGHALSSSGDLSGSAAQFEAGLALARSAGDRTAEARALSAVGVSHSFKGEEQTALELQNQSLAIARAVGDRQSEGVALNGLGQAYEGIGKKQVALDHFQQALQLFLKNESLDFATSTEYLIARFYRLKGDAEQALVHYRRSIALSRRANKKRIEAYALTDIAAIHRARGRRGEALDQYKKVLELYRRVGDRRGQSVVLTSIGDLVSDAGDHRRALSYYERALPLMRVAGNRYTEAAILHSAALAARDSGALEEALDYAGQSVQLIETLRTFVTGPDLRLSYVASVHKYYDEYIDLLMRLDKQRPGGQYAADALLASEGARARSLLDLLAENGMDIRRGVEPRLLERERELQQMLRDKAQQQMLLYGNAETEAEAEEAARDLRHLTAEYQVVQAQIREQNPRYATLTQPRPITLADIQAELRGEDTVLLEYVLGEEKSYLWVVTASSFDSYDLPGRAAVEAAAREVYGLLVSRQSARVDAEYQARVAASDQAYGEKALALSRMLLGPVGMRLGGRRLLIVAEGALQYIPFEALPVPDVEPSEGRAQRTDRAEPEELPLLVSRHEIISLPSVAALIMLRRERPPADSARGLVAVLADPVYGTNDLRVLKGAPPSGGDAPGEVADAAPVQRALKDFGELTGPAGIPRLRHTSDEANAIISLASSDRSIVATGFEASRETAMSPRLGQYQIIHFATHGLVNSEHPELSGIILSLVNKEGGKTDGFLQLHDIYNLDLPAELVVLSACNTGLGKDVKGEGLIGLTRVFFHAGSKSVVASLWKVDDAATAELMRHFYKAMLEDGLPPAAALRLAKEALRREKRWRAPYYWAGFVMQGEYRQRIKTDYGHGTAAAVAVALATFCCCVGLYVLARLRVGPAVRSGDAETVRLRNP